MPEKQYALEWYNYGLEKGDDKIVKFMMHWIAFNWLYSECRQESDDKNIEEFCKRNFDKLSRYDAFGTGAFLVFADGPVRDEAHGYSREGRYRRMMNGTDLEGVTNLLLTIYQVRCNLFHGSKSLYIERDIELVHSSATIMEGYLKALLIDHPPF